MLRTLPATQVTTVQLFAFPRSDNSGKGSFYVKKYTKNQGDNLRPSARPLAGCLGGFPLRGRVADTNIWLWARQPPPAKDLEALTDGGHSSSSTVPSQPIPLPETHSTRTLPHNYTNYSRPGRVSHLHEFRFVAAPSLPTSTTPCHECRPRTLVSQGSSAEFISSYHCTAIQ